jgi:hypothetical protein
VETVIVEREQVPIDTATSTLAEEQIEERQRTHRVPRS